jgi:hypothetical protein
MAHAKNRCSRTEYTVASEEYAEMMTLGNAHHDLSSLAECVVPPFNGCGTHHVAKAKVVPTGTGRDRSGVGAKSSPKLNVGRSFGGPRPDGDSW